MKKEIPMPAVIGIVVVLVALVAFAIYRGTGTQELEAPPLSEEAKNNIPDYLPEEVKQKLREQK